MAAIRSAGTPGGAASGRPNRVPAVISRMAALSSSLLARSDATSSSHVSGAATGAAHAPYYRRSVHTPHAARRTGHARAQLVQTRPVGMHSHTRIEARPSPRHGSCVAHERTGPPRGPSHGHGKAAPPSLPPSRGTRRVVPTTGRTGVVRVPGRRPTPTSLRRCAHPWRSAPSCDTHAAQAATGAACNARHGTRHAPRATQRLSEGTKRPAAAGSRRPPHARMRARGPIEWGSAERAAGWRRAAT